MLQLKCDTTDQIYECIRVCCEGPNDKRVARDQPVEYLTLVKRYYQLEGDITNQNFKCVAKCVRLCRENIVQ